jgi:hypothetical protein
MIRFLMSESDLRERLGALIAAVGQPAIGRPLGAKIGENAADAVDAQRVATAQIDELLRRVAAITGVLGKGSGDMWDDVDRLAAQLLLADLGVVTATTRALNELAAARLSAASAELGSARAEIDRVVSDVPNV